MRKLITLAFVSMATLGFAATAGATVINLDAVLNASTNGTHAITESFDAGTYKVTFTQGQFTAFSRWKSNLDCDTDGQNCAQGWENSAVFFLGTDQSTAYFLGDGGAVGGVGSITGGGYFDTEQHSFGHSSIYSGLFTLASTTNVSFLIGDNNTRDNRGGVSLLVERLAVPEPAPWPFMLAGLGLMAALLRLRQRKASI